MSRHGDRWRRRNRRNRRDLRRRGNGRRCRDGGRSGNRRRRRGHWPARLRRGRLRRRRVGDRRRRVDRRTAGRRSDCGRGCFAGRRRRGDRCRRRLVVRGLVAARGEAGHSQHHRADAYGQPNWELRIRAGRHGAITFVRQHRGSGYPIFGQPKLADPPWRTSCPTSERRIRNSSRRPGRPRPHRPSPMSSAGAAPRGSDCGSHSPDIGSAATS